jgi:hypothetical protein
MSVSMIVVAINAQLLRRRWLGATVRLRAPAGDGHAIREGVG